MAQTGACEPREQSLDHGKHPAIMSMGRVEAMDLGPVGDYLKDW